MGEAGHQHQLDHRPGRHRVADLIRRTLFNSGLISASTA